MYVYIHHTRSSDTTTPRTISPQSGGQTPLWIATSKGHIEAVKQLISAGCDMNLASTVKQMTRLALALARSVPFARLPLPPLANLNLQYLLRLLLES